MIGRIISIVVVVVIVAGAAWALWPRAIEVETATIARGELTVSVEEEGVARIRDVFRVTAPVSGRLVRVAMHAGDPVTLDQTVATIEPAAPSLLDERARRIAEATVQTAEAAVAQAEASLAQAEAQNDYARSDAKRKNALAERGLLSTQLEEQASLAVATAAKNVDVARATLTMRQQDLASARAALMEGIDGSAGGTCCANVTSPITGEVLAILTESEQVVQPGTPLMELGDPGNLEIAVDVLSTDAVGIAARAPATIEGWGGDALSAEVVLINPTAFTKVSALGIEEQRAEVVLRLLDPPQKWARLGHGFRVIAHIVTWHRSDVTLVPIGALFRRGDDWAVFVVKDGKASLQTISLGRRNGSFAEIASGLALGDVVVNHPGDTVADGTAVAVQVEARSSTGQ